MYICIVTDIPLEISYVYCRRWNVNREGISFLSLAKDKIYRKMVVQILIALNQRFYGGSNVKSNDDDFYEKSFYKRAHLKLIHLKSHSLILQVPVPL